jgi:hypothetical protein
MRRLQKATIAERRRTKPRVGRIKGIAKRHRDARTVQDPQAYRLLFVGVKFGLPERVVASAAWSLTGRGRNHSIADSFQIEAPPNGFVRNSGTG